jgi:O-antigen/teichoic acid export membrane protein
MDLIINTINRRLISGGSWAFSGKVLTVIIALAVNVLLARLLTPEALGAYFLTLSLVTISVSVAQFGLNMAVVRFVAESIAKGQLTRAAKSVWIVFNYGMIGAVIVAVLLVSGLGNWLAMEVFDSMLIKSVIGFAALWIVIMTFQNLTAETFRGFNDIRFATIFGGLLTGVISALLFTSLWIVKHNSNLAQIVLLSISAGIINALIAFILLRLRYNKIKGRNSNLTAKEVLVVSWPLWLTSLTILVLAQVDLWILGIFVSQQDVAVYGAAVRIAVLISMPLLIVNAVIPPIITEMHATGDRKDLEKTLRKTATIAAIPAIIILLFFIFFSGSILSLIYGDYYKLGSTALKILSFGKLMDVLAGSCGLALAMTGHQKTIMLISIVCCLFVISMSILLVNPYGLVGVASASAFGTILWNLLALFAVKQKINIWTHIKLPITRL